MIACILTETLQWRHNGCDSVSNHQPHDYLLKRLFRRKSTKTSKFRVTGLCEGNSPVTGEFPAQRASNTENASIWWRHHEKLNNPRNHCMDPPLWLMRYLAARNIFINLHKPSGAKCPYHGYWHKEPSHQLLLMMMTRDGLSQWEDLLQCNAVSHWPSPYTERSLLTMRVKRVIVLRTEKFQ